MGRLILPGRYSQQPQEPALIVPNNGLYDYAYYPIGNQFWAANEQKILTRGAGTSGIGATISGLGLAGDGSTYFTLPASITFTAPYSINVIASAPLSTASMPIGDQTGIGNFLWIYDGSGGRWRCNGGDANWSNSNTTKVSVYGMTVDSSDNVIRPYKDGVALATTFNATPTFKLNNIGTGYSSSSFNLGSTGYVVGVFVRKGVALSAAQMRQMFDNPWQGFQKSTRKIFIGAAQTNTVVNCSVGDMPLGSQPASIGLTINCSVGDMPLAGLTGSVSSSTTISCSVGGMPLAGLTGSVVQGTVAITTPVAYQTYQRNGSNQADIAISGTYTGFPTSIEASFNGGAYQTISASPSGGTYSGTLTAQSMGQGTLTVRFANITGTLATVSNVAIGDVYITFGQSNNVGHANTAVGPTGSNGLTATTFDVSGTWKALTEAGGATTSANAYSTRTNGVQYSGMNQSTVDGQGSYIGQLATRVMQQGVPVCFVPCAVGSTSIADWISFFAPETNPASLFGAAVTRAMNLPHKAAIWWQGETDAAGAMSTATYETDFNTLATHWYSHTSTSIIVNVINYAGGAYSTLANCQAIQQALLYVGRAQAHCIPGANMDGLWTGNVHYGITNNTSADPIAIGNKMFDILSANYYGGTVINCSVGDLALAGPTAGINNTVVNCSVGDMPLAGKTASFPITISCNVGDLQLIGQFASGLTKGAGKLLSMWRRRGRR